MKFKEYLQEQSVAIKIKSFTFKPQGPEKFDNAAQFIGFKDFKDFMRSEKPSFKPTNAFVFNMMGNKAIAFCDKKFLGSKGRSGNVVIYNEYGEEQQNVFEQ
jgi:hypothetical protein